MYQPTGLEKGEGLVCKLKKSLYGLTPAARIWYETLVAYLRTIGSKACTYDTGLFMHQHQCHLYMTSHVDEPSAQRSQYIDEFDPTGQSTCHDETIATNWDDSNG